MFNELSRNWQLPALCGLATYFLGTIAVVWPDVTLYVLTLLFGAYTLAKGLLGISVALPDMVGVQRCWVPISDKSSVKSVGIQERRIYRRSVETTHGSIGRFDEVMTAGLARALSDSLP